MRLGGAEQPSAALVEQVDQAGRLHQGQGHGQVPGGLGQLLLAHRPLVTPLLQLGDDRGQQLDDDARGDVGHDPQPEHGHPGQGPAGEEVEEAEDPRGLRRRRQLGHLGEVDEGDRDVGPELVQGDDGQREEDLLAKVGNPKDVGQTGEHGAPRCRSGPMLPVGEGVALGRRPVVAEGKGDHGDRAAGSGDGRLRPTWRRRGPPPGRPG